ncbi:histone deacetylase family protein [Palleronia sediminis]|uniref:Histone deacetylase family protein n=1 Tax=Palleronia sediminis TaxID=2547833 RepID=A0A4R6AIR7_9RHOB|nr:histone deacetylase family protein [Palleronia sediminis]TDL81576.1 histone deacetylase family protein [Palleronia sediminis]
MTIWFSHPSGRDHVTPEGHPERVARLDAVERGLAPLGLDRREAPDCSDEDIALCHPAEYLRRIEARLPTQGHAALDGDTILAPGSLAAARHAVGGTIAAIDAVLGAEAGSAFVGCRPPGHHAETETAMGFCLFGTAAIGARHALQRWSLDRVAVVDFDVHHGNGTQDLLWSERNAMFVSTHQMPLFPGTGNPRERGAHGQILNLPLDPGTDGGAMRLVYERQVLPALRRFQPGLIIVSAGFDAHRRDPLANLDWEAEDFAWITERLCDVAHEFSGGRIVSTLEGGYDLDALEISVAAHVGMLKERCP